MRLAFAVLLPLLSGAEIWTRQTAAVPGEVVAGIAAAGKGRVFTWGDTLRTWNVARLTSRIVARGPFGEGACTFGPLVVTVRGRGPGDLVAIGLGDGRAELIDSGVEMHDCLEATLFGRRGLLLIQRGMQVRFYERKSEGRWSSRDIYSIYTPSYQTGLAIADVDGDGRPDIFCGNYWIRSPARWEESWRLFAINTWFEGPDSASLRIVVLNPRRIAVAQAHVAPARIGRFEAPPDPRMPWTVTPLASGLKLAKIHALVSLDGGLLAAEQNGPGSRIVSVETNQVIGTNDGTASLLPLGRGRFLSAGPDGVTMWRLMPESSRP